MQLTIKTNKKAFLRHYLELLNGILKLTPRELDSLLLFIEFDPEVACSMQARKHVADRMNFKNVSVLNNYVKSLKDKKVIYKDETGVYRYNHIVKPSDSIEQLTFQFVVEEASISATIWDRDAWHAIDVWADHSSRVGEYRCDLRYGDGDRAE